jgi:hypothetical protein
MKFKTDPRSILACALLAIFIVSAVFALIGAGKTAGIDPMNARDGVMWINSTVQDTDGNSVTSTGTGWAIGKPGDPVQYIVTNAHVVEYAHVLPKEDPSAFSGEVLGVFSAAENDFMTLQVVYFSPPDEKDIAILRLPVETDKRTALSLRPSEGVSVGETVYALGYPSVSSELQSYTKYDQSDITVTKGIVSKRSFVTGVGYESFQMDTYINSGNSGGPLVDENGFVVGINTLGAVDPDSSQKTDMNFAIITDELIKILDSEGIPYALKGSSSWLLFVFIPLALIALAGAAYLHFGKEPGSAPVPSKREASSNKRPVLRGVAGQYAGEVFAIGNPLTLGRDAARCNIVFDPNTPGVSSNHCTIRYNNNGSFILTDNGSSYGTFLANGKKLSALAPETLYAGDSFYLADTAQRFVVTLE